MLKRTPVMELVEGMVLGRPIYKEDMSTLLTDGTVLTKDHISAIRSLGMAAVYILVEHDPIEEEQIIPPSRVVDESYKAPTIYDIKIAPTKTKILDSVFVEEYMKCFEDLKTLYEQARAKVVDLDQVECLVSSILPLAKGAKAISQIHNLEVEGDYILHHSLHVAILAGLMGKWLRWSKQSQRRLIMAALFMDVGNVCLPPSILDKSGSLTLDERKLMQRHVELGHEIVSASMGGEYEEVATAILQHHERNDGTGYPKRRVKEKISKFARILALLDMYDAMGSNRSYAKKKSPFEVFEIMSNDITDGKLDTDFGFQFIRRVCHSLHGNWVQLSNGEKAKIVYIDESRLVSLPVVQTMEGAFIDLNRNRDIQITHLLTNTEIA